MKPPFFDHYLRQYRRFIIPILHSVESSDDVIDFGAGTQWVRQHFEAKYTPLDIAGASLKWNFNDPLPDAYRERFDLAISLNSIHYAFNPVQTIDSFLAALRPGGSLLLAVPWMYPPHDKENDRWRLSPLAIKTMFESRFEEIFVYDIGTVFDLPARYAHRLLFGGFKGFAPLASGKTKSALLPSRYRERNNLGPLTVLIYAKKYRAKKSVATRSALLS